MRTRIMHQALAAALLLAGAATAQGVFESHGDLGVTPKAGAFAYDAAHTSYRVTGEELTVMGAQTVDLAGPVYVGTGMSSHDANILETAVFSNVQLEQRPAAAPPQRYRSKVTVFDLAARSTRVVYQADQIVEAPNWSRDGSFLLINTGGSLYRLPVNAAGEPKLEKIELGEGGHRANNDHDLSRDGKWLAFSASSTASRQSQVWLAHADGAGAKLMTPASPSYFRSERSRSVARRQVAGLFRFQHGVAAIAGLAGARRWRGRQADDAGIAQLLPWVVARRPVAGVCRPAQWEVRIIPRRRGGRRRAAPHFQGRL